MQHTAATMMKINSGKAEGENKTCQIISQSGALVLRLGIKDPSRLAS